MIYILLSALNPAIQGKMGQKAKQEKRKGLELRAAARGNDSRIGHPAKSSPPVVSAEAFSEDDQFQSGLPVVKGMTMDKAGTILMDDGFSIRKRENGWRVQVSIVDMPSLVADGSPLEEEASHLHTGRETTDRPVQRIFPYDLLRGKASFQPGMKSRAITFDIALDEELNVTNSSIYRTIFKNCCSYYFNKVDEDVLLGKSPELATLLDFGQSLYQKRITDEVLSAQEKLKTAHTAPTCFPGLGIPKSRQLVSEVLHLANRAAAQYLINNKLDAPFHTKVPDICATYVSRCYEFDRQVNIMAVNVSRSITETTNSSIRVTAPMRAYNEFLGLKVIAAHLDHRPVGEFGARMVKVLSEEFRRAAAARRNDCDKSWRDQWQNALERQKSEPCASPSVPVSADTYQGLSQDCKRMGMPAPALSTRKISTPDITLYLAALKPVGPSGNFIDQTVCAVAHHPYDAMKMVVDQFRQQIIVPKRADLAPNPVALT